MNADDSLSINQKRSHCLIETKDIQRFSCSNVLIEEISLVSSKKQCMDDSHGVQQSSFSSSYQRIIEKVKESNGEILSPPSDYKNLSSRLCYKCKRGHIFYKTGNRVLNDEWCRICGLVKSTDKINEFAKEYGGACTTPPIGGK